MMRSIFIGSLFLFSLIILSPVSHAQVPFGGLDVMEIPCTCGFVYNWHFFAPLFLNNPVPIAGPLAAPQAIAFPFYILHPGAWALGIYTPGVQACWMYVGWGCAPLASYGLILPLTGSSP
ncbi:MAG: hypothetical protein WAV50_02485 [Minisyncoccia bacterium]